MCDKIICTYKTYHHDAKYLFELYSMTLHTEPSIGASHQISVHLAKQFQKRRFLEIDQSETRIACSGHVCQWIKTK
jgi:hypothetical protein